MRRLGSGGSLGLEAIFGWIACREGAVVREFWRVNRGVHVEDSRGVDLGVFYIWF